jgi:hypothetical protein
MAYWIGVYMARATARAPATTHMERGWPRDTEPFIKPRWTKTYLGVRLGTIFDPARPIVLCRTVRGRPIVLRAVRGTRLGRSDDKTLSTLDLCWYIEKRRKLYIKEKKTTEGKIARDIRETI